MSARTPLVELLNQLQGRLQITETISAARFVDRSPVDALYVQRMNLFLVGLADDLATPTCLMMVEVPVLECHPGQEKLLTSFRDRYWYSHYMFLGHLLLHDDYAVM